MKFICSTLKAHDVIQIESQNNYKQTIITRLQRQVENHLSKKEAESNIMVHLCLNQVLITIAKRVCFTTDFWLSYHKN